MLINYTMPSLSVNVSAASDLLVKLQIVPLFSKRVRDAAVFSGIIRFKLFEKESSSNSRPPLSKLKKYHPESRKGWATIGISPRLPQISGSAFIRYENCSPVLEVQEISNNRVNLEDATAYLRPSEQFFSS